MIRKDVILKTRLIRLFIFKFERNLTSKMFCIRSRIQDKIPRG